MCESLIENGQMSELSKPRLAPLENGVNTPFETPLSNVLLPKESMLPDAHSTPNALSQAYGSQLPPANYRTSGVVFILII